MKQILCKSGKYGDRNALVDDEDFDSLNKFKWYLVKPHNIYYAVALISGKMRKMHRVILKVSDSSVSVDHKDRNGLNNQKSNIRLATNTQNMANRKSMELSTSQYLGVYYAFRNRKWKAQIRDKGKLLFLGYFIHEINAAKAYNEAALKIHGVFANINKFEDERCHPLPETRKRYRVKICSKIVV